MAAFRLQTQRKKCSLTTALIMFTPSRRTPGLTGSRRSTPRVSALKNTPRSSLLQRSIKSRSADAKELVLYYRYLAYTAESMLSKRPVLQITVVFVFSPRICFIFAWKNIMYSY